MRGGESNERDTGDSPDQHGQPQDAPPAQDKLAQSVQAVSPQGVPLGAADVWDDVLGGDRGSDHICAAGGTDLKGEEVSEMARIMQEGEFNSFYETIKKELAHMNPGESKRVALIGALEGYGGSEIAFTGDQLRKIFDLGFLEKKEVPINEAATSGHSDIISTLF